MDITEEKIQEMKDVAKRCGEEWTDEEARKAAYNLQGYAELVIEIAMEEVKRNKRLKKEPNGFPPDGHYSCKICRSATNQETGWYDKYGFKCLLCQSALNEGVITTFALINDDSYFSMWKLTNDLNVRSVTIRKFIKQGRLKARIILNNEGKEHACIFLKKENPDLKMENNPVKKSYDRNKKKKDRLWVKEKTRELKADWKKRFKKAN